MRSTTFNPQLSGYEAHYSHLDKPTNIYSFYFITDIIKSGINDHNNYTYTNTVIALISWELQYLATVEMQVAA